MENTLRIPFRTVLGESSFLLATDFRPRGSKLEEFDSVRLLEVQTFPRMALFSSASAGTRRLDTETLERTPRLQALAESFLQEHADNWGAEKWR